MDVTLQRHSAKYIYVIPEGLKELMSDISREVLRTQPQNLYLFIADYLEALLLTRENARVAARLVQSITEIAEATMEFLHQTGMERPQADKIVGIIHETFKKRIRDDMITIPYETPAEDIEEANIITDILHEADIGAELAEEAAKIIQNAYRKFKHRKEAEKQLLSGMIDWRIAARSAIRLYRQTGVTTEEASRAATLIKAAYKGYYTRRVMKQITAEQKMLHPEYELEEIKEAEEEEGDLDYRQLFGDKYVKIDYDTVIPHVDFGDATDIDGTQAVVSYALEKIVDNAIKKIDQQKEITAKKAAKPVKEKPVEEKPSEIDEKPSEITMEDEEDVTETEPPSVSTRSPKEEVEASEAETEQPTATSEPVSGVSEKPSVDVSEAQSEAADTVAKPSEQTIEQPDVEHVDETETETETEALPAEDTEPE